MFDFTFGSIMASMVVSGIGFVFFKYGRRQGRSIFTTFGIIITIYPYFIYDTSLLIYITAGLCAVL